MFNSIKIAVFWLFLFGVSSYLKGQSVIQIEKRAKEALKNKQYEAAKIDYQILVSREPSSADYNFHYALCVFHTESKKESQKYFEVSIKNSSAFCEAHYYLGRIFHAGYLFTDAITAFETYRACDPSDSKNAAKEITYCQQGSRLLENPRSLSTLSVFSSPISTYTQKYPLDDIGGLIFSDNSLQTKLDKKNNYMPLCYFKRGDTYKFYASYGDAGEFLKLYFIKRISQDVWSKPEQVVLGTTQAFDAVSPFYDAENHVLYFAANGLNSMGGFDLFKVPFVDESVSGEILNLDFPFSSSADDFYYIPLNPSGTKACFASDRNSPLGKIQVFTIQNQLQQNETLVLQGQFVDLVDTKNTRVQVTVKDSEDGMVYGPFTSNDKGQYQITLPGPGEYEFTASINGTMQVFQDTKRIPSQKSNITFKQTIKYSMDNLSEVAQFLYDFNGPISQELKAYKANILSSLTLNPKISAKSNMDSNNLQDAKIDEPVKDIAAGLVALGFTQPSLEEQSNALADRLLELSLKGTLIQDEIDALTESMETLSLNNRQLQENIKTLEREIDRSTGNPFQQAVYQKELKNTMDSLEKIKRKQLVVASLIKTKQTEKNQWDLSNQEPSVTELSDAIKLSLMKGDRDSLTQLLALHEKKIEQFIKDANSSNAPKNNAIVELQDKQQAIATKLVALQNEQKLLADKQASLVIQEEKATKKELEAVKSQQAELKKSSDMNALSIQTLQKENENTSLRLELMKEIAALNGGNLPKEEIDLDNQSAQIEELLSLKSYAKDLVSVADKNDITSVFEKDLSTFSTEDKEQLNVAVQSEMLLLKSKLDNSSGEESQRLAERYQWLEAKSEELNASLATNTSIPGAAQTRTQETTTNPTTGATEPTNGVAQTRTQETTTNPTTGATEPTNGVAQTRTQETTTNPTTGTTEPANGVAQTRTQETTTNPTTGTTEPANGVTQTRTQETTTNPTTGATEPTNGVAQTRTQETTTNPTTGTTEPVNGVAQTRTQETTTNPTTGATEPANGVTQTRTQETTTNPTTGTTEPANGVAQTRTQETTTNPTTGATEPTNGVAQTRTQETTTNPTTGATEPTNGVAQTQTQETTTNPTTGVTEPANGVAQTRTQETTTNPTTGTTEPTNGVTQTRTQETTTNPTTGATEPTNGVTQTRTQETTTNPTTGATEPTNGVAQTRTQETTTNPTTGATEPTNGAAQTRTQETTTNPTTGTTEPANGVTQTRTQETTTNPTTGTTEPANGVTQTRTQETTTNPTTGATEPTNGVTQTRTQETTTNPTTGATEPTNGLTQTRTQETTTNPTTETELKKNEILEGIKEEVVTEMIMLDKLPFEFQETNALKAIKNQLNLTSELIQLSQVVGEKGMNALYAPLELQYMAQDAMTLIKQLNNSLPSNQQIDIQSIQALIQVFPTDMQAKNTREIKEPEHIDLTDELIAKYASNAEYDRYVSVMKEQVKLTLQRDVLNGRISTLKNELYTESDDIKRTAIRNELIELVQQKLTIEKQQNELDRTLRRMPDYTYFSALLDKQILPKSASNETSIVAIDERALEFQVGGETNVQRGKLPVLNQMPMGLIFRVQVGAFRYKVPGYFFREFSPVSGEKLTNNLTAYLVGFFVDSKAAKTARTLIRQTGYQDAFIVAYCDGKRIPYNLAIQYEQNGMCNRREQADVLTEVLSYFKDSINQESSVQSTPKEIFYTVQVASLKKEDNGKLNKVPDLFYSVSVTGNYKYSSGKFSSLNDAKLRRNELRVTGYTDAFIVAYRDGIPVSFQEAELGLAYMKEDSKTKLTPVNTDLLGVKTEEPVKLRVQYKKPMGTMALSDFAKFNQLQSCVLVDEALLLAPLEQEKISPLFQILYADFDATEIPEKSIDELFVGGSVANLTIAHDFALRGTVPFQLTNSMNEGTGILFYPSTETEKIRIMDQLKKLNLIIKD